MKKASEPVSRVLDLLEGVSGREPQWSARCPAHEDRKASLSIGQGKDGKVLLTCHAGCSLLDILRCLELSETDLFPEKNGKGNSWDIECVYPYHDENGKLLYEVVRFRNPKDFRQRRPDGAWNVKGIRRVLYRLPELKERVFVVEGEKDVESLKAIGIFATTNSGGAGKWEESHTGQLQVAGVKEVIILPDNDEAGERHAVLVGQSCLKVGIAVKLLRLPGLPEAGDVTDWIKNGGGAEELECLSKETKAETLDSLKAKPEDEGTFYLMNVVEQKEIKWLWRGRIPLGKVTVLDGDPGLGKSTVMLDLAARVSTGTSMPGESDGRASGSVILLSGEDDPEDTIAPRLSAVGADLSRIALFLGLKGGDVPPSLPRDVGVLKRWIQKTGTRLVVIDPLMEYLNPKEVDSHKDQDVRMALRQVVKLARETGTAIVIVRHLNKTFGGNPLYRGSGSIGIIGISRSGLMIGPDPEDKTRRLLAVSKTNLALKPPALAFRLISAGWTCRVAWEGETTYSAEDLLQSQDPVAAIQLQEAREFLGEALAGGARSSKEVLAEGKGLGISRATIYRATIQMGIRKDMEGFGKEKEATWSLPA